MIHADKARQLALKKEDGLIKKQLLEIEKGIDRKVEAGKFELDIAETIYKDNIITLKTNKYKIVSLVNYSKIKW